jgi:hypothetical protein
MAFILFKKLYLSSNRTWNRFKKINTLVKVQISREGRLQALIPEPVLTKVGTCNSSTLEPPQP